MYKNLRPLLFRLDAESAHTLILNLIRIAGVVPSLRDAIRAIYSFPGKPVKAFGLKFKNPVGLAAGFDKDGIAWKGLALLGFSHIELGTVTPQPQTGNERPRIFRLPGEEGLLNRMGFPGRGAEFLENQIINRSRDDLILGVNIGKNANTPLESSAEDYQSLINRFAGISDYLVINISSPNTIGLRRLQARRALDNLLAEIVIARQEQEDQLEKKVPLLVKLSPDLADPELKDAVEVILHYGVDGIVATNTSSDDELLTHQHPYGSGGISGNPIMEVSLEKVRKIFGYSQGMLPIIGVGGISSAEIAKEKLDAGAILIQVYTGLVYQGPGLVKSILQGLTN